MFPTWTSIQEKYFAFVERILFDFLKGEHIFSIF